MTTTQHPTRTMHDTLWSHLQHHSPDETARRRDAQLMLDIAIDTPAPARAAVRDWLTSTDLRDLVLHGTCHHLYEHIDWLIATYPNNTPIEDRQITEAAHLLPELQLLTRTLRNRTNKALRRWGLDTEIDATTIRLLIADLAHGGDPLPSPDWYES